MTPTPGSPSDVATTAVPLAPVEALPAPAALDYAEPPAPAGPQTTAEGHRLEINLGAPTQLTFITRVVLIALLTSGWAAMMLVSTGRWRRLDACYVVLLTVAIVRIVRTRLEPDVIVADADGISARGPTAGAVLFSRADIDSFTFHRDGVFWLRQLCVRLVADGMSKGEVHVIAVADRAAVIRAAADLNGWLAASVEIRRPDVPTSVRLRNQLVLAAAVVISLAVAVPLGKMAFDLPIEQKMKADVIFAAAILIGAMPPFLALAFLSDRKRNSGDEEMPRLHRNNAAERVMVVVLTSFAWTVRCWRWCFRSRKKVERTTKRRNPPRRGPVIEGLPPRNMN